MNRFVRFLVAAGLGTGLAGFAQAGGVSVGVGIGVPGSVYAGPPVIYAPPPVIYGPPVIFGPRPWPGYYRYPYWYGGYRGYYGRGYYGPGYYGRGYYGHGYYGRGYYGRGYYGRPGWRR
ncbi:hypothetical protein [Paraburkholderia xenovorans]|uniref:hypothetical protein n=1 Tax=Paraburkholderia xenovorans TaxID=36873 RepID=UPI0038BAE5B1